MKNYYQKFKTEIIPALVKELGLTNLNKAPRLNKIVINVGLGRFVKEAGFIEAVEKSLAKISGQKPVRCRSKKSISNFKIREGQEIGVMATLRGPRMYDFVEKLVKVTFPRMRDFRGVSTKSFDGQGNYTIGFKEHTAFPEIRAEDLNKIHGIQIIINTTAKNKTSGKVLLKKLGFPFSK